MNIDTRNQHSFVDIHYAHNGQSSATDALGMREMQAKAYEHRTERFLLIKAPPASGKSRALMFIALDKLVNQGIKKVVVAVPEKSIGRSFRSTGLKKFGFFADWNVAPVNDLCSTEWKGGYYDEKSKAKHFCEFMDKTNKNQILVCAHATLQNAMKLLDDSAWDDCLLAIDEFHHTSADARNMLGDTVRRVMNNSTGHIIAMTGSYFRGDAVPVMRAEDEARFKPVTYNYYQQLNGYRHLKHLVLGYHFYKGVYLDHLTEVLDTTKKTIIHIPNVNGRASTGMKYYEVEEILKMIGEVTEYDYKTCIYTMRTKDGRLLKVADLVEDDPKTRDRVQGYLQKMKRREDMDIIIALGTAKEGFDWEWCECCLTIGVRGSLTEVVQIIGRCTRDCEGKETARFINMIAMPDAEMPDVKLAVNDFMKAITASLLMEQVMTPNWKFRTLQESMEESGSGEPGTITITDLPPLSTDRTREITIEQIDDLKVAILSDDDIQKAIAGNSTAETFTQYLVPKIIREKYPDLSELEAEEVRYRVLLDLGLIAGVVVDKDGNPLGNSSNFVADTAADEEEEGLEGKRFLKLTNRLINIDKLSVNLINTINPFQRAYEIISKSVDAPTLKIIQDTIAEQRFDMPLEQAIVLFKGPLKDWIAAHDGRQPSLDSPNMQERELAQAFTIIKNLKVRRMMGLDFQN